MGLSEGCVVPRTDSKQGRGWVVEQSLVEDGDGRFIGNRAEEVGNKSSKPIHWQTLSEDVHELKPRVNGTANGYGNCGKNAPFNRFHMDSFLRRLYYAGC